MFGGLRNLFGGAVGAAGKFAGLPEFGISERISGQQQPAPSSSTPTFSSQGSAPASFGSRVVSQSQGAYVKPTGQILGANTGGGVVNQPISQPAGNQGPVESAPSEPQLDFSAINQALSDLSNLETETRNLLGGGEAQAEAFRKSAQTKAEEAKGEATGAVEQRGQETQQAGTEAELQQRRGFSEIAKQFLGRFGTTGFGEGVKGALSESVLQNIGRIRSGVQQTLSKLEDQRAQIERQFNTTVEEANFQSEQLKGQARAQLQQALAEIGTQRGALRSQKADLVNRALEQYRQDILGVNARNQSFLQNLALQKQQTDEAIRLAQSKATDTINNLASFELSPGQTKVLPVTQLGGEQGASALEGTTLPGGLQFQKQGQFGIFNAPGDQNLEDQINNLSL